jgi:hypothetical protein
MRSLRFIQKLTGIYEAKLNPVSQSFLEKIVKPMTDNAFPFKVYGDRLIAARGSRTRAEIERLSGVPYTTITRAEDGKNQPPVALLLFYAQEGVTPDLIVLGEKQVFHVNQLRLAIASLSLEERLSLVSELAGAPFDAQL